MKTISRDIIPEGFRYVTNIYNKQHGCEGEADGGKRSLVVRIDHAKYKFYKMKNELYADLIGRGGAWLDTGSMDDFYKTSNFVSAVENRQGLKIACLEEIAFNNNWITKKSLKKIINKTKNETYRTYLQRIIS